MLKIQSQSNFVLSWFSLMEIVHDDNCSSAESGSPENWWFSRDMPILKKRLVCFLTITGVLSLLSFVWRAFSFCPALEEDYERKRWERKVRKMRGRPKKRRRREVCHIDFLGLDFQVKKHSFSNNHLSLFLIFLTNLFFFTAQRILQNQQKLNGETEKS